MRANLTFLQKFLFCILLLLGTCGIHAQILNAPTPAPNQTPPVGSSPWTQACASDSFNDFWVNFTWSPPLVNSGNEFVLELSDENGNFSSPVELARDGTKNTDFDFFFQFTIPTNIRGEGYRMRVRSTDPAITGPASAAVPMYYIDVNSAITIRPQGQADFGDGTAEVCDGNSITLEVYDLPNASTYQYNWYRSGTPLPSEKSESITVSQAGMYIAEIDYGSCSGSGNTLSNIIDVTTGSSLGIAINPPAKTDLCSGETADLIANIVGMGLTYTWFKDGTAITSPTVDDDTFTVDASSPGFEGDYQVEIYGPGACLERSAAVTITNAGDFNVSRDNPANMIVLPGQTEVLSISTDASSPTFQWYRDGSPVSGETTNSITVDETEVGTYFCRVSLSGGACASTSIDSPGTVVVVPDSFEAIIDYSGAYASCANTSIVLQVVTINALDGSGGTTDVTAQIGPSLAYQWNLEGAPVSGATTSNISLADISENGNYTVDASIASYNFTSNTLPVQLLTSETLEISSTSLISCSSEDDITISTTTDLTGETFDWYRDGQNLNVLTPELDVLSPGTYQLVLQRNGCPLFSNEIVISPLDPSIISLDPSDTVIFPEGSSRTVTASGGDSYIWYNSDNVEISNSSSINFSEEGTFTLVATVGNCDVTRTVTVEYLDTFQVPNVITVNGDGINDLWILPNSYSNKDEVNVIIYNEKGEQVLNVFNYQNNWPQSSTAFPKQNMVFFYKIRDTREVLKQGTITIIR